MVMETVPECNHVINNIAWLRVSSRKGADFAGNAAGLRVLPAQRVQGSGAIAGLMVTCRRRRTFFEPAML